MLGSILIGFSAAVIVFVPTLLHRSFDFAYFLGAVFIIWVLQAVFINPRPGSRSYDGLADLFVHIHSPMEPDSPQRWAVRGLVSFLNSIFGIAVGIEGAAIEWVHALSLVFRSPSSRWFEQKRRTDAAQALAAGISAAFGAPFAAVLVPIELGVGGRGISIVVASLSAFLSIEFFMNLLGVKPIDLGGVLYGFRFIHWKEWAGVLVVSVLGGLAGTALSWFVRFCKSALAEILPGRSWFRIAIAGCMLAVIIAIYPGGHFSLASLLETVLWSRRGNSEILFLLATQTFAFGLVLAGFGTLGIFWPLFFIGCSMGGVFNHFLLRDLAGFSAVAGLSGGAAFWGSVLNAPLSGAVVAFEMTQNIHVLLPCLISSLIAKEVRKLLRVPALLEGDLSARGFSLKDGRSRAVLETVPVSEAMVTDYARVHEHDSVKEIHSRLIGSRYPFLPVVNTQGRLTGLLTIDMVHDAWKDEQAASTSRTPLSQLLEAKDLLYRSGFKTPRIHHQATLDQVSGGFGALPCIPVVDDDDQVVGLLLSHNVRLAYDREVARRSLENF